MRQEKTMWIVELNFAGYRVTRQIPTLSRTSLRSMRFRPRSVHWRAPQLRHWHAA
jgi:hypothetical protein